MKLRKATLKSARDGWIFDYEDLETLQTLIEDNTGTRIDLETLDDVLITLHRLGALQVED